MPSIVMVRVGNPPPASHPIRPLMPDSGEYPRDFMNVKGFRGGGAPYGSVRSNAPLKITMRSRHAKGRRVNVPIMFIALDDAEESHSTHAAVGHRLVTNRPY